MIRVRRALLAAAVLAVTALLTTGCPRRPDPPFEGTTWILLNGTAGAPVLVPGAPVIRPNTGITAVFKQLSAYPQARVIGEVTGTTACNTYKGSYRRNGSELVIDSLTWTKMACAPDIMSREATYLALLPRVTSLKITGLVLELSAADGTKLLSFGGMPAGIPTTSSTTARPFSLAATYGVMQYLRDTTFTPATTADHQVIVQMQPDGSLVGQACNRFEGTWSSSGDTIHFEASFTTEMACTTPAMQDLEQWFLPALTSATHWQMPRGGPLTLTRADGTTVVSAIIVI